MCDEQGNSLDLGAKELRDIKSRNNPPEGTENPGFTQARVCGCPSSRACVLPQGTPGRVVRRVLPRGSQTRGSKADRTVARAVW